MGSKIDQYEMGGNGASQIGAGGFAQAVVDPPPSYNQSVPPGAPGVPSAPSAPGAPVVVGDPQQQHLEQVAQNIGPPVGGHQTSQVIIGQPYGYGQPLYAGQLQQPVVVGQPQYGGSQILYGGQPQQAVQQTVVPAPVGGVVTTVPGQAVVVNQQQSLFGKDPMAHNCRNCGKGIVTVTEKKIGGAQIFLGFAIAIFGCACGCCLIPCFIDQLKDVKHTCPNCNAYLGEYSSCGVNNGVYYGGRRRRRRRHHIHHHHHHHDESDDGSESDD